MNYIKVKSNSNENSYKIVVGEKCKLCVTWRDKEEAKIDRKEQQIARRINVERQWSLVDWTLWNCTLNFSMPQRKTVDAFSVKWGISHTAGWLMECLLSKAKCNKNFPRWYHPFRLQNGRFRWPKPVGTTPREISRYPSWIFTFFHVVFD